MSTDANQDSTSRFDAVASGIAGDGVEVERDAPGAAPRRAVEQHRRRHHRTWVLALGGILVPLTAAGLVAANVAGLGAPPSPTPSVTPAETASTAASTSSAAASTQPTSVETIYAAGARSKPQTGGVKFIPSATGPLSGKVIVVDPGHTGKYDADINMASVPMYGAGMRPCAQGGAISINNTRENTLAWKVSQIVVPQLLAQGATVVLTRIDDASYGPCNNERAEIANREKANLLLSIHFDGVDNQSLRGFHIITSDRMVGGLKTEKASQQAAGVVAEELKSGTTLTPSNYAHSDEGPIVVHRELGALNGVASAPAVLVECANIRQAADAAYVESAAGQQAVGAALAKAAARIVTETTAPGPAATPTASVAGPSATPSTVTSSAVPGTTPGSGTGEADAQPAPSASTTG